MKPTLEQRFWSKVDKNGPVPTRAPELGPCWLWVAGKTAGYGAIRLGGNKAKAHRLSFFLAKGRWPTPVCRHLCDVPLCVNPKHLVEGTWSDNAMDQPEAVRVARAVHANRSRRKLTDAQVLEARRRVATGESKATVALSLGVAESSIYQLVVGYSYGDVRP